MVRAARAPALRAASFGGRWSRCCGSRRRFVSEGCVGTCPACRRTRARPASNGIRPRVHVSCMRCRGPPTVARARALTPRPARARPSRDANRPRDSHAPTPGAPVDRARASPGRASLRALLRSPARDAPGPRRPKKSASSSRAGARRRLRGGAPRSSSRRPSWTVRGGRWCPRTERGDVRGSERARAHGRSGVCGPASLCRCVAVLGAAGIVRLDARRRVRASVPDAQAHGPVPRRQDHAFVEVDRNRRSWLRRRPSACSARRRCRSTGR